MTRPRKAALPLSALLRVEMERTRDVWLAADLQAKKHWQMYFKAKQRLAVALGLEASAAHKTKRDLTATKDSHYERF